MVISTIVIELLTVWLLSLLISRSLASLVRRTNEKEAEYRGRAQDKPFGLPTTQNYNRTAFQFYHDSELSIVINYLSVIQQILITFFLTATIPQRYGWKIFLSVFQPLILAESFNARKIVIKISYIKGHP